MQEEPVQSSDTEGLTFEQALVKVEQIVRRLEEGQIGLDQSLAEYEQGVQTLKRCYHLLEQAEHKIQLLAGVDAEGNPVTEPFDDQATSLDRNAKTRSQQPSGGGKSSKTTRQGSSGCGADVDLPGGLF